MSEVAWEDQQKINEFSKLNSRLLQHEKAVEQLLRDDELLKDVSLELELIDENEMLQYKIGDVFVFLPQQDILRRLENDKREVEERIANRQKELETTTARMDELKSQLYAKFGSAINLEREPKESA